MHISRVFWYAVIACVAVVLWGSFAPDTLNELTTGITGFIYTRFGWFYKIILVAVVAFCFFIMFSRFGDVRLGGDDDEPEFSLPAWFSMLFSAGMGIGLLFFATAETISHAFVSSPNAVPGSDQAVLDSLQYAYLHWGVHGWGLYATVGLVLAYFQFRVGSPGLISSTLEPLFGKERMRGTAGQMVDTLAIIATVVGVASTLGFGAAQINSGLTFLFNAPNAFWFQLVILGAATVLYIVSAWSGLGKGIKYLSSINMWLAILLMCVLFMVGPTVYILNLFTTTIGNYIDNIVQMSFDLKPVSEVQRGWVNDWTIFYWAWWISWAPFVGMFIARVSKGRTIKEFMTGVLIAPALFTMMFFAVFGGSALNVEQKGLAQLSTLATETVTFGMYEHYPLGTILSVVTIVVIAIFFITSADSASFVLGMFSTGGKLNPSNVVKVIWGLMLSSMAAIVLYSGGIHGFQNMLIIAALPFSIILILSVVSFYKHIKETEQP